MRNREKTTCPAIAVIVDKKFVRMIYARYRAILCHNIFKKSFIDKKAYALIPMGTTISKNTKSIYKLAIDILEFMGKEFNKVYHDIYRAFYIFFTDVHTVNIPQNYVKCKHKVSE